MNGGMNMYDTIIIGAGPAGFTAAIYAARAELDFLLLEREPMGGGQIINTYEVDNYPGLQGISGFDLAQKFQEHAEKLGAKLTDADVTGVVKNADGTFTVSTRSGGYDTKTVILAGGAAHARLGVPGEEEFGGLGVSYCATCDGAFFKGKTAVVVGGGDVAAEDAIFLARGCSRVYLVHRRNRLRAAAVLATELAGTSNIEPKWNRVVTEIKGSGRVESVMLKNVLTGETEELPTDACFIAVGIHPNTEWLGSLVKTDEKGYIAAGEDTASSLPGIFAAGDIRTKRLRQIITAAGDGANAVTAVQDYLLEKR
jgi:thioredoxin reductase (NADPH)